MTSVADLIHEREAEIMRTWLEEARAGASARGLSAVALENAMPLFLASLADQIETGQVDANDRRHRQVQRHLSARLRQGFDLPEIVDEFIALGRCIAGLWRSLPADQWPPARDIARLHLQIQAAIAEVTETFTRHMLEDEQSEKRYLRLLQEIASTALHDEGPPLHERLGELMKVVMQAMRASCAAFLLYDTAQGKPLLVASAGADAVARYLATIDPTSVAGAESREPTPSFDTSVIRREVPESLRDSGVQWLLGVRLPARENLVGVIYIGIAVVRELTPRERQRLAALGERISLHLENSRLFMELRDKVSALDREKALRERFVSALAHDLRGPLSAARLAAELLAMQPASLDERRDLAVRIDRNIERVDRMIHDLLDVNRIRAGEQLPLRLESCDLAAVAEQVAEEARRLHGDRFHVDVRGPVRGIWSEDDLHRALWNLVTNAVKYGARAGPITIAVRRDADLVRVSVHNQGTPIPAAEQPHLFEAYARSPAATAGAQSGWGLGLTLVRGVAEAHGGHASLTSDAESGTTFTIELPVDARCAPRIADEHPSPTVH